MNDWRALVDEALHPKNTSNSRDTSPAGTPSVPSVPIVPPLDPARAVKLCSKGLGGLDPAAPLHGLSGPRWRQLLDDADWLLVHFGHGAFRDGWTVGELFGLWWAKVPQDAALCVKDGWGGIADRLQGARSLKMTAERAHWRRMFSGEPDQFNRGAYVDLRPLWEPGQ